MEQSTSTKPVMDVMPPKPVATPVPAVLPSSDADSGRLPSANPSLAQEDSRTVTGGTDGGAPGAPQPLGEHDGEASMSDRTRTESELAGGSATAGPVSGGNAEKKDSLTVHQAPPLSTEDKASVEVQKDDAAAEPEQKPAAHTAPPKPHGPIGAITLVILGMVILSALAIVVYLNV